MQRQRKVLVVSWLHILLALCHMELLVKIQSPSNKALRWAFIMKTETEIWASLGLFTI